VTPAPDHARLRDEMAAIDRRMNAHLACFLGGGPVPVGAALEDGLRLFGLAAVLLDRVEELERAVPQPSLSGSPVPHENPAPPPP
jgi:hypothetical protein